MTIGHRLLARGLALLVAVTAAGIVWPTEAIADEAQAAETARQAVVDLRAYGYAVRDGFDVEWLEGGETQVLQMTLLAGNHYLFVVGGDVNCDLMSILVFDENMNVLDADVQGLGSRFVRASISPSWTGPFFLVIGMGEPVEPGAHWMLRAAYSPHRESVVAAEEPLRPRPRGMPGARQREAGR